MTRTFTPDEIAVLIAKLEAATKADWVLNCHIRALIEGRTVEYLDGHICGRSIAPPHDCCRLMFNCPNYTASLDAALMLVPDGCNYLLGRGRTRPDEPIFGAIIFSGPFHDNEAKLGEGEHDGLLSIALCIAALKARATLASAP